MPKIKPLPCPFCGKRASVIPLLPETEGNAWGSVLCVNMKCPARPAVQDGAKVCDDKGSDKYKEAAIKRWNRRAKLSRK